MDAMKRQITSLGVGRWGALLLALLGGCAHDAQIDNRYYPAKSQNSRVQFLVLHYTNENLADSLRILTQGDVSAHYLVSDETPPRIYRLVDESRRAWHAGGDSAWKGATQLNASSIGIEIVNGGDHPAADGKPQFAPFPDAQIDVLIPLIRDIAARHEIPPNRIVGHSDVSPQRKIDPGPLFPWHRLAQAGLIPWPDAGQVAAQRARFEAQPPDIAWFQKNLATLGFQSPDSGTLDDATRRVIAAFQMRYRPSNYDGTPDAETAALLHVLNQKAAPHLAQSGAAAAG
jgi:N-acetylmuramoyl-L-alanine amidase